MVRTIRVCLYRTRMVRKIVPYAYGTYTIRVRYKIRIWYRTEPPLQSLSDEELTPRSANCQDDARADIHARGFWGRRQSAFFDVRVFHPNAQSYTAMFRYHLYIGVMRCRRRGSMVTVSVRWSLHLLLHWCLPQLGAWGRKPSHFIAGLLSSFPNVVLYRTVVLWRGFAVPCLSPC